jgi:hypothetical protein
VVSNTALTSRVATPTWVRRSEVLTACLSPVDRPSVLLSTRPFRRSQRLSSQFFLTEPFSFGRTDGPSSGRKIAGSGVRPG